MVSPDPVLDFSAESLCAKECRFADPRTNVFRRGS